jgi:amino acid adenylation domain-containing protein
LVVGLYGILKAGAAYVPLDPEYPSERLEYMAEAAGLHLAVTESRAVKALEGAQSLKTVVLDQCSELLSLPAENPDVPLEPNSLIYIIFTSGTTGRPKGAAVYHRGFSNLMEWFVEEFQIGPSDRVLLVSSPSFDLTQKNLFAPLVTGGTLHLLPSGHYDAALLSRTIESSAITLINCTPSAFYPVVEHAEEFSAVKSLRVVFLGGEPISLQRVRRWLSDPCCNAEIANTYGPTECTDICAFYRLNGATMDQFDFVPLGSPIPNVQLAVFDEAMRTCEAGEIGELWIGGAGVGAGYVNDPDLTRQRFASHGIGSSGASTMYRTGDQVRWIKPNLLEYLGRNDHQIKIRGFRVELREIEEVLRENPAVIEAVVVSRQKAGHVQLKAYYITAPGSCCNAADLRAFASAKLPAHMVPTFFEHLATFPLSPNGKVDRSGLATAFANEEVTSSQVPSGSGLRASIHLAWSEVLGSASIEIDDNFFDVGGNSLALADLHRRLERISGRTFAITELFTYVTVRAQSGYLESTIAPGPLNTPGFNRADRQRSSLKLVRMQRSAR